MTYSNGYISTLEQTTVHNAPSYTLPLPLYTTRRSTSNSNHFYVQIFKSFVVVGDSHVRRPFVRVAATLVVFDVFDKRVSSR